MRVIDLAKQFNISTNDILNFIRVINKEATINMKLSPNDISYLKPHIEQLKEDQKKKAESHIESQRKNWFTVDLFSNIKLKDGDFETYFTDIQVINLVRKLKNTNLRNTSFEFFTLLDIKNVRYYELRIYMHELCERLKVKFGSKLLSFIHNLPEIQIGVNPVATYIAVEKGDDEEFGHFKLANSDYCISFDLIDYGETREALILITDNNKLVAKVDSEGTFTKFSHATLNFNLYQILIEGRYMFFTGNIEINCAICGRPLTDPDSIRLGAGPICRNR